MKKLIILLFSICISVSGYAYPRIHVVQVSTNVVSESIQDYEMPIVSLNVTGSTLDWQAEVYFGPADWFKQPYPIYDMGAGSIHAYQGSTIRAGALGWYGLPRVNSGKYINKDYLGNLHPVGWLTVKGVRTRSYGEVYLDLSW